VSRAAARWLGAAAILLGGILLGSTGCGSVTAKKSDGGGTGGSHADSSTKMDVAADRKAEDARHDAPENHDSSSGKDMRMADARTTDASAHGGSGGGGTGGSGGGAGGSGGGAGGGSGGAGGAGECKSNGDCMLYTGLGSGCCGVCQPKSAPTPPPIQCLIACLDPLVTCGCVNQKCVGSAKQL
jgi:hypothetical protein